MLDSSGKLPDAMSRGSFTTLGDYDVCLATELPGHFRGQFCNVDLQLPLPERERFVPGYMVVKELANFSSPDSVVSDFTTYARYFYRVKIRQAVCVPSTCSRNEVEKIALAVTKQIGLNFDLKVSNCETKVDKVVFTSSEIAIIVVLSTLLFTSISATVVDVVLKMRSEDQESYHDNLGVPMKCLMCFSLYTNFLRLLKPDKSPDSIKIFHGMKVVTILWVVLNHTFAYLNYQAMKSPLLHMDRHSNIAMMFILNGYINVETFFFISAVLLAYGHMKSKADSINVFLLIIRRVWRLAPPFMFVIACVLLVPHLGSGPVWKEMVTEELAEKCYDKWWTNLLFINNFYSKSTMCMHWMWYIPADTHLYILSLLVIIPLKRNPRLAFTINALLFVLLITVTAVIHVVYNLAPTAIFIYAIDEDIDEHIDTHYFRSWVHIASYSVGLVVGYLLVIKPKMKIPMKFNILGWIVSLVMGLTVVYGVTDWNTGILPGAFVSTLYACTNKLVFALALGWVTITCMTGHAGVVKNILSWGAFVPLGRLTYMTYLIHPIIQHMYIGSYKTTYVPDFRTMVFNYLAYVMLSFMCACALSLLFESPFLALEKVLLSGGRKPRTQITKNREVELGDQKHNGNHTMNVDNGVYTINIKQIDNDR